MSRRSGRKGLIGKLVGAVGEGVGMAADYREHRKQQKQQSDDRSQSLQPPQDHQRVDYSPERPSASEERMEDDEEDWLLDEAISPPPYSEEDATSKQADASAEVNNKTLIAEVMAVSHAYDSIPPTGTIIDREPLQYPVIIPQRRPQNKSRGFIRAYAPVLQDRGISQETFMQFLKNFQQSSKASPVFTYVQVAAGIAGLVPSAIVFAVTTTVQIGARAGAEVQSRMRTNDFLDRMNEELFKPAGLYAMIVKYKPEQDTRGSTSGFITVQNVDLSNDQTIAKYDHDPSTGSASIKYRLRTASKRSAEIPIAAPLIFPDLDARLDQGDGPETFKGKMKDAQKTMASYLDRRAQTKYARQNPDSGLASITPSVSSSSRSQYTDPDGPMYNNGLRGLVSGGHLSGGVLQRRRDARWGGRDQDDYRGDDGMRGRGSGRGRGRGGREGRVGIVGGVRKALKGGVLYLMVVDMPSEEEIRAAREELEEGRS